MWYKRVICLIYVENGKQSHHSNVIASVSLPKFHIWLHNEKQIIGSPINPTLLFVCVYLLDFDTMKETWLYGCVISLQRDIPEFVIVRARKKKEKKN